MLLVYTFASIIRQDLVPTCFHCQLVLSIMETPDLKFHVVIKDAQTGPKSHFGSNAADDTKPCDDFYPAWIKFLSSSPTRTAATSTLAIRVERAVKAASEDDNGLNSHKSPAKSYEEASAECSAKVRAIVAECERLNQKYVDRYFDIDYDEHDCIQPLGNSDYDNDGQRPSAVKRIEISVPTSVSVPHDAHTQSGHFRDSEVQ